MGTNYYMMTKDRDLVTTFFPDDHSFTTNPFEYQIHIGKRSCGWKPLFAEHKNAYASVEEMKSFIKAHKRKIRIVDEYGRKFTLDELQKELIDWGEQQKVVYMKHIPEGVPDEIFKGRKYLVESTESDYDITIPYDHVEYETLDVEKSDWKNYRKSYYSKDKDGYNFMNVEFC